MKLIELLVDISNIEMEEPIALGGFHLFSIVLIVFISALMCTRLKDASPSVFRKIIGSMFFVMLTFEVFKEVFFTMSVEEGRVVYEYDWTAFPFQLCSTPLYILPLLAFLPDSPVRDAAAAYTMTFAFIGGVSVFIFPDTIYTECVMQNIQTTVHHGIQVISGALTAAYYRRRISPRFYGLGVAAFAVVFAIANLLNTVGYNMLVSLGAFEEGYSFNMFFISPRADQTTPMLNELFDLVPPVVFIVLYFIVLSLGAAIVSFGVYRVDRFVSERK